MNLRQVLQENGFSEKAAKVYLALLAIKEGTVSDIAKRARIKRPTAYLVLAELESQGLVSHVKRGGSLHYRALNPFSLLERQHDRFHSLREAMPELVAMSAVSDPRPQMSVFEGEKGLREIMEDTLTAKGEILYWADMTIITTTVFKDYWRLYVKKRVAKRISTRGILCADEVAASFKRRGAEELREAYLVPKERFPFTNEINIYNDKVAIISHLDLIGVVIENKNIANSQRSIFNLAFEYAKILDRR